MILIRKFLERMLSEWWSALSGPLSVPLAIFALFSSNRQQRFTFGVSAFILAFVSAYRIWEREYRRACAAVDKLIDERPRLTLAITPPKTFQEWNSHLDQYPAIFHLLHSGGRVARYVKISPIASRCGKFNMVFGEIPSVNIQQDCPLIFTIFQNGVEDLSSNAEILKIMQGLDMFRYFLLDHSKEEAESSYPVTVEYRDQDGVTAHEEFFILRCRNPRLLLSVEPAGCPVSA